MCRQNLTDAMKRLTKMEADYGDVIPRRDYLALEVVYKEIEAKNEIFDKDLKSLKTEHRFLKSSKLKLSNYLLNNLNSN